jgi:hypothetical protein
MDPHHPPKLQGDVILCQQDLNNRETINNIIQDSEL